MDKRLLLGLVLIIAVTCVVAVAVSVVHVHSSPPPSSQNVTVSDDLVVMSEDLYHSVNVSLTAFGFEMQSAAKNLSSLTPQDNSAKNILHELYKLFPESTGVAWVDANGTTVTYPMFNHPILLASPELKSITEESFAENDILLIGPVYSNTYGMVLCLIVPVYSRDGTYNGYLCVTQTPNVLINETPRTPFYKNTTYELWVGNNNGDVLYHPDSSYIGTNYYTNPRYQQQVELHYGLGRVFAESEGTAVYQFYPLGGSDRVNKTVIWKTLSFGGQDLRLVLADYPRNPVDITFPPNPNVDKMISDVQQMAAYAKRNGQIATLSAMSNPNGLFTDENYEIFAYTMDGTVLSMPSREYLVGENRINHKGVWGLMIIQNMINRCLQGGGYVHYYDAVPYSDQAVFGVAYVLPIDANWFVGAQMPILNHTVTYDIRDRYTLVHTVQAVQDYIATYGKEATLAMLMDPSDELTAGEDHIFAMDYNGILLADETNPQMVGKDIFYLTDPHGTSVIREIVMVAKQGGGYVLTETADSTTGVYTMILMYVQPVDDEWCVVSSAPLDSFVVIEGEGHHE